MSSLAGRPDRHNICYRTPAKNRRVSRAELGARSARFSRDLLRAEVSVSAWQLSFFHRRPCGPPMCCVVLIHSTRPGPVRFAAGPCISRGFRPVAGWFPARGISEKKRTSGWSKAGFRNRLCATTPTSPDLARRPRRQRRPKRTVFRYRTPKRSPSKVTATTSHAQNLVFRSAKNLRRKPRRRATASKLFPFHPN
jgi:hypothetical protein